MLVKFHSVTATCLEVKHFSAGFGSLLFNVYITQLTEGMYVVFKPTHILHACTPHAPSFPFFSNTTTPPGRPTHTHSPAPPTLYTHLSSLLC